MAVGTSGGIVEEVGIPPGVDKSVRAHSDEGSEQNAEYRRGYYRTIHARPVCSKNLEQRGILHSARSKSVTLITTGLFVAALH